MNAGAENRPELKRHTPYIGRTPPVHRCGAAFALVLGLAACAVPTAQTVEIGLRNPTVPLGGTTRFDPDRFAGDWQTVACLGACAASVRYVVATDGVYLRETEATSVPYLIPTPGVLREMGGTGTLVVMWVDEGFRTAAVGDANGRWAAIVNRKRKAAPDRVAAAREILDFNGWDISQLRPIK